MPIPAAMAAAIPAAAAQAITSIGGLIAGGSQNRRNIAFQREANAQNIAFQQQTNQQQMAFQREMYDLQRRHSLQDFTMQNEYNSPTSQMARLREAGLNPHLVYGNGATQTAAPVRSSSPSGGGLQAPNVHAPKVDNSYIQNALNLAPYFQMQNMALQADNLKQINTKLSAEAKLLSIKSINEALNTDYMKAKIRGADLKNILNETTQWAQQELAFLRNDKLKADIDFTQSSNVRADKLSTEQILRSAAERGLIHLKGQNLQQVTANEGVRNDLLKIERTIRNAGGNPNDPAWQRILIIMLAKSLKKLGVDVGVTPL